VRPIGIYEWQQLDAADRSAALARPAQSMQSRTLLQAQAIIEAVRTEGDNAVRRYTREFDGVELGAMRVSAAEFSAARAALSRTEVAAIERAIHNVDAFHRASTPRELAIDLQPGVRCERLIRPIQVVGLYVPAGSAPLPSTVVMLAVPARIAGCASRILCTPPDHDGHANAAVLVAAELCGIDQVFKIGGAQAIAAMAYGTASVPKVAKIFGPGNAWVTAAKQLAAADPSGAALDLPAGPSEVLVIADDSAQPDFIAADLLAQAEHDPLAQAVLLTTSGALAEQVAQCIGAQSARLSRQSILQQSLNNIRILRMPDLEQAIEASELYAPEHLILAVREPRRLLDRVHNAGSVFLGHWSPETVGDYCSGTNHVLPTYGYARAYSGLSVDDFTRRITVQELSPEGLAALGPTACVLAQLEGLDGHAAAVELRLRSLANGSAP
jgi:histidinol dehydrogenase